MEELNHSGIKGMRWGQRRYQNKDGSLTEAGKKRYARDAREQNWEIGSDGIARSTSKKTKGEIRKADPSKWVKEDLERSKRLTDASNQMTNNFKNANRESMNRAKNKKKKMDLSNMTDKEMRDQINRALLEKQYDDMFNPPQVSKGREFATNALEVAGSTLAITSSALGIALAIKELKG